MIAPDPIVMIGGLVFFFVIQRTTKIDVNTSERPMQTNLDNKIKEYNSSFVFLSSKSEYEITFIIISFKKN